MSYDGIDMLAAFTCGTLLTSMAYQYVTQQKFPLSMRSLAVLFVLVVGVFFLRRA